MSEQRHEVVLVVDVANVMGSRPDGWWRDRAGAATRLLAALGPLVGAEVSFRAEPAAVRIVAAHAVLEGAAKPAEGPDTISVLRAARDGDGEIVAEAGRLIGAGKTPLVITADRGLRHRLPEGSLVAGPGWLNPLLGR